MSFTARKRLRIATLALLLGWSALSSSFAEETERTFRKKPFIYDCIRYFAGTLPANWKPFGRRIKLEKPFVPIGTPARDVSTTFDHAFHRWFEATEANPSEDLFFKSEIYPLQGFTEWGLNSEQKALFRERLQKWKVFAETQENESARKQYLDALNRFDKSLDKTGDRSPWVAPSWGSGGDVSADEMDITAIVNTARSVLDRIGVVTKTPRKVFDDLIGLLLPPGKNSAFSIAGSNAGIKAYLSKQLTTDTLLYTDTLDFYSRLSKLESSLVAKEGVSLWDAPTKTNVWNLALESTEGDSRRALRVLAVFGHDDVMEAFDVFSPWLKDSGHPAWLSALNAFNPPQSSILYQNGAIEGLGISETLRAKFLKMKDELDQLEAKYPDLKGRAEISGDIFRAGNYHFYGAAFLATEMMLKGHDRFLGVRLPVFLSETLGTIYKRLTMESNYLDRTELNLFHHGYPEKSVAKPAGMSDADFEFAKYKVRLNLLHLDYTREQHRKGAEWAYEILKKAAKAEKKP